MEGQKFGIAWNDIYLLDDEIVDAQHKRIFELLSDLVASCVEGSSSEQLSKTLNFLAEYTVNHFHDEESLQIEYNYPDYKRHKEIHENFKGVVGEIIGRFRENGSSEELSNELNKIVAKWLVSHIMQEDKRVGVHVKRKREFG